MSDYTVIPPFKIAEDVWLPLNPGQATEALEDLASSLMVAAINRLFPGVPVSLNLDGTIDIAGVDFSLELDLCPKICPPGTVKSIDGRTCGCPEGFDRNDRGNCVCVPGWWAIPLFNDRPLPEGVTIRNPPRVFITGVTRPTLPPGIFSHEQLFRPQAKEVFLEKYDEWNLPATQLSTLDQANYVPFWHSGVPDTERWMIDGIIYVIEAYFCPPPKTVVPAYITRDKTHVKDGFVYKEQSIECGDFTIDFDDVVEVTNYSVPDEEITYQYGTFYTSQRTKTETSQGVSNTHYKTWDGRIVNFANRSHSRVGFSNNPDVLGEDVYISIAASMNWAFINYNGGTIVQTWDRPDEYTSITTTLSFGVCPVATPFVTPIVEELLCVDNTGVEHLKTDSEFNFYACRVSNTATCAARFLANGLARLAAENDREFAEWVANGSPPAVGLLGGAPVITPADITRVTALAAIEAAINCPQNIDNGSYPPLYLAPLNPL